MSNNYGEGVSRVLDPATTQFLSVIWQEGAPPLDSEWNLVGDLAAGWDRQKALLGTPSGWFGNDINPSKDYQTNPTWSNWFKFGRQRLGDKQSVMWAAVNGWLIPVVGTRTGDPPGSPDDVDTWNKILLDPPPGSAGDARADFVFLEVWKARISPYPSTINKPNGSAIYRYGNLEGGQSYLPDDLIDPAIGEATTERVQLQYRIRVVKGLINLGTNPDGFDPSVVKAQGAQATPPSVGGYTFTNMREELGDPGLWRAGDGSANVLGTVDGYVYAVPICVVFRRNSILWAGEPSQNLNGGFNRNPFAVDRTGAATFSTVPTLGVDLLKPDLPTFPYLSATLAFATNIPLPTTPTSQVLIRIDEELMTYSSISGTNVTLTGRGVNGTAPAKHLAGATITVVSTRPDGLYSDQVTLTDILDLRHAVNPAGFNYTNLLRSNLDKLLKGQLRSNWKKSGADPRGIYLIYQDKISATPAINLGITTLDAPDHIRLVFSDAAVQQPVEAICKPTTWSGIPPVGFFPAVGAQTWGLQITVDILSQAATAVWTIGDQLRIPVAQFKTGVSVTDADQIRLLNDQPASGTGTSSGTNQFIDATQDYVKGGVAIGDSLVIFSGAAAGTYPITSVTTTVLTVSTTIPTASPSYVIRKGVGALQIRVEGQATALPQHYFSVTPPNPLPTQDLVITLGAGSYTGGTPPNLYITTQVQYGGGRGLSRRPDSVQDVSLLNPSSQLLYQTEYTQSGTFSLSTAWAPLWSKYRSSPYKSLLPVTAEAYADLGSKTVAITPFQTIQFPTPTAITVSPPFLPTPAVGVADPLGLFQTNKYVILPRHLVPGWGEFRVPILPHGPSVAGTFNSGINFMLLSQEGKVDPNTSDPQHNQSYLNYYISGGASCAVFSTSNLTTHAPATYSTSYPGSGCNYAGMRLFNDDPAAPGALTTARGLGRQGLELPPFYGIARLFAVYEASEYAALGSCFLIGSGVGNGRSLKNPAAGATNLLRDSFDGPTFWVEKDVNGDSTFILNAEAIDISKATVNPISNFGSGNYVIEACVFGFGRGSFDTSQPFKLALSSTIVPQLDGPNAVLPGPLFSTDNALINYSRTPYQGDAWGTTTTFSDKGYTPGPLTSANAYQLSSTSLNPIGLTRPNQKSLEVLASVGFITTLGTGRLSGDFSVANAYDIRNVGYEDPTDPTAPYPPPNGSAARPLVKSGALGSLSNYGDLEANPEYLGCTERLPLGGLYRDKDFHGSRFSDELSSPLVYVDTAGVGSGVAGLARTNELDQTEILAMPASVSAGVPGDVLVLVDGSTSDYTQLVNYRTNRGGSVFVGSGDRPGGEVFATYSRLMGSGKGTRVLVGRAFLVRNAPTLVGATEVSGGDELMLAITTDVMELGTTPIEAMLLIGTNGSGEGSAAADLYRIEGHPLLANHTLYDVDPSAIELPRGKTIAQIVAPSPTPAIPVGALNTVYCSDGVRNFWSNIPTLTGLNLTNDLALNANIVFTATDPAPTIYQSLQAPGVGGKTLSVISQAAVLNSSSVNVNGGWLWMASGDISTATPGYRGTSGLVTLHSGSLGTGVFGNTGDATLKSGIHGGTGNSGSVFVGSGQTLAGNSGGTTINTGNAIGLTGQAGTVTVQGGHVTNTSNPSGSAGNVTVQGGTCLGLSGNGGSVNLVGGPGTLSNGTVNVKLGSAVIQYASFTNLNLILGPTSGSSSNYGIQFSALTTNATIGQADSAGNGSDLYLNAQNAGPGIHSGGNLKLVTGRGTSGAVTGDILFYNGYNQNVRITSNNTEVGFSPRLMELGDTFYDDTFDLVFSSHVYNPVIGQLPTFSSAGTFTIKAADVQTGNTGGGGHLQLLTGAGNLGNGRIELATPTGVGLLLNDTQVQVNRSELIFDRYTASPLIYQPDTYNSESGRDLSIQAQNATDTGWSGGSLLLKSGTGDAGGGSIRLEAGNSPNIGGSITLTSGQGAGNGSIHLDPGGFNGLTVTGDGAHLRTSSGTGPALFLQTANADPPTSIVSHDGIVYVNTNKHLSYGCGFRNPIELSHNAVREYVTADGIGTTITSAVFVDVVVGWSHTFQVQDGEVIEGEVFSLIDMVGAQGYLRVKVDRDSGAQVEYFEYYLPAGTATLHHVQPFSFKASGMSVGVTAPAVLTFEARVTGGAMTVTPLYGANTLWLKARHLTD